MSSILTAGYQNRSIGDLIALMKREGVQYLIDVRSTPVSRVNPEFSGEALERTIRPTGIRYVFMGDTLGGRPRDPTCYQNGHVMYSLVRQKGFFCNGIDRLLGASAMGFRLLLLCRETRPEQCHRSKLIGVALAERGTEVIHVDPQGEHVTQSEVMARLKSEQRDLFGDELYSRKAYRPGTGRLQFGKVKP